MQRGDQRLKTIDENAPADYRRSTVKSIIVNRINHQQQSNHQIKIICTSINYLQQDQLM